MNPNEVIVGRRLIRKYPKKESILVQILPKITVRWHLSRKLICKENFMNILRLFNYVPFCLINAI